MTIDFQEQSQSNYKVLFADVIIPRPFPNLFTYRIPQDLNEKVKVGARVVVDFGKQVVITALIAKIHTEPPKVYQAKMLLELLDEFPSVNAKQLAFFQWMADYYMCYIGEILQAALPSGLKITSEANIQLNPFFKNAVVADEGNFTDKERLLLDAIAKNETISYQDAVEILETKNVYKTISKLQKLEAILVFDTVKEKFKPKIKVFVQLQTNYRNENVVKDLIQKFENKPHLLDLILRFLALVKNDLTKKTPKSVLMEGKNSDSSLKTLIKQGVFESFEQIISRFEENSFVTEQAIAPLSEFQKNAEDEILEQFQTKQTVLLHGITGSGKTEIYIQLIEKILSQDEQVLFLLPEIALTTQIVYRLHLVFGTKLGVYHSRYSDNERVEVWQGVQSGRFKVVVGVRSSIFLPFDNLGLIIVDEEHETSYKQFDPAPRYHARDAALYLAQLHHAKVLLGSATPAIESYHLAKTGKWGLVKLNKRFGNAQMPTQILVDTKAEKEQNLMQNEFTSVLLDGLKNTLAKQEQSILFQNRRGYAPYISCEACGFVPECQSCAVSLTYHLYSSELSCHYCGYHQRLPKACPACGSPQMKTMGYGTEKIEEELALLLPKAKIARMDLDTTRKKHSYQQLIQAVENREIDILVGTQMVTKGLDFDKVSLVGVFDIDRMLHFPDFRSNERVFQLLVQVSGRAGRKNTTGTVIIQTSVPQKAIFEKIKNNDYEGLYEQEIIERERFAYPPFVRMIKLTLKDPKKEKVAKTAFDLAHKLKIEIGTHRILGPEPPSIDRIRDSYLQEMYIKLEKGKIDLSKAKKLIRESINHLLQQKEHKGVAVVIDVDSY
jgi:primosomal protein N' (replication factor Y) (superfamily II helicase)